MVENEGKLKTDKTRYTVKYKWRKFGYTKHIVGDDNKKKFIAQLKEEGATKIKLKLIV